jgi:hypothetical protein
MKNLMRKRVAAIFVALVLLVMGFAAPAHAMNPQSYPQAAKIYAWDADPFNPGVTARVRADGGIVCAKPESYNLGDLVAVSKGFNISQMTVWMKPTSDNKLVRFTNYIGLKPVQGVSNDYPSSNYAYEADPRLPNTSALPNRGRYDGGQAFRRKRVKDIARAVYTYYGGRVTTLDMGELPINQSSVNDIVNNNDRVTFDFVCNF